MALHSLADKGRGSREQELLSFPCSHPVVCCCDTMFRDSLTAAPIIKHPLRCWPWSSFVALDSCL